LSAPLISSWSRPATWATTGDEKLMFLGRAVRHTRSPSFRDKAVSALSPSYSVATMKVSR
jgi:hypothetical protein